MTGIIIRLWFAWKFVPLWYQQQLREIFVIIRKSCDLLENSYLCGINNNNFWRIKRVSLVVICLKIRTFVVSTTTSRLFSCHATALWFAWKFVPLWYQQQLYHTFTTTTGSCDLLENSYLCGINNNTKRYFCFLSSVVICLKIRTFVVSTTTHPDIR